MVAFRRLRLEQAAHSAGLGWAGGCSRSGWLVDGGRGCSGSCGPQDGVAGV